MPANPPSRPDLLMPANPPSRPDPLDRLRVTDTPTVCNALELVMGDHSADGFTRTPVVALDPRLPPIVGYAVTARIEAARRPTKAPADVESMRRAYYRTVGEAAIRRPSVVVIEDTDDPAGVGAFWGEVNVAVHQGLGVQGVLTNGSMRDLDEVDEGFQILAESIGPSHAFVRVTDVDVSVDVLGLTIEPGDLIHADRHGAVVISAEHLDALPEAIAAVMESEKPVLDAARHPDFDLDRLFGAWGLDGDLP